MKQKILFAVLISLLMAGVAISVSTGGGGVTPPKYVRTFDESGLSCSNEPTLEERIRCRYNLPENYKELTFLPEECRNMQDKERDDCLHLYNKVGECWETKDGKAREACLKQKTGAGELLQEKSKCSTTDCLHDLREKYYSLAKLRLYSLEEKAEELEEAGVGKELIIRIVTKLEQAKVGFNSEQTISGKKKVLEEARGSWQEFKRNAAQQLMEKKGAEK